jgi:methionyl-tRNA formyltransferase
MKKESIKFAFLGTGDFAVKILEILHQNNLIPGLIITTPDKPKGRKMLLTPPLVKIWAEKNNIKTIADYSLLIADCYDLFIIADYGKIIPKEILDISKHGALNIHPSLLPKFRGPSPIQSFILSGEKETGVAIILLDEEMDHGPIIAISSLKSQILNLYYKKLEEKLAELGGELLIKIIPDWISGKIKPQKQNHKEATYTKKIRKNDGLINLDEPAESIERKIRALTPWPGVYTFINGKRLLILEAEIKDNKLRIIKIKPEGKNEMDFEDFLRGNHDMEKSIQKII